MVSKSFGQVLRMAGVLNILFLFWDIKEVVAHEKDAPYPGDLSQKFEVINTSSDEEEENGDETVVVPISCMAMECAISISIFALTQNMALQNVQFIKFDPTKPINDESFVTDFVPATPEEHQQQRPQEVPIFYFK